MENETYVWQWLDYSHEQEMYVISKFMTENDANFNGFFIKVEQSKKLKETTTNEIWISDDDGFYITNENELFVILDRSEFLLAKNNDIEYLKSLTKIYMDKLWDMVDNLGYDTVEMLILPETKTVKFFQEDFSLGEEVPFDTITKKEV